VLAFIRDKGQSRAGYYVHIEKEPVLSRWILYAVADDLKKVQKIAFHDDLMKNFKKRL
jgi:hypothetical protein